MSNAVTQILVRPTLNKPKAHSNEIKENNKGFDKAIQKALMEKPSKTAKESETKRATQASDAKKTFKTQKDGNNVQKKDGESKASKQDATEGEGSEWLLSIQPLLEKIGNLLNELNSNDPKIEKMIKEIKSLIDNLVPALKGNVSTKSLAQSNELARFVFNQVERVEQKAETIKGMFLSKVNLENADLEGEITSVVQTLKLLIDRVNKLNNQQPSSMNPSDIKEIKDSREKNMSSSKTMMPLFNSSNRANAKSSNLSSSKSGEVVMKENAQKTPFFVAGPLHRAQLAEIHSSGEQISSNNEDIIKQIQTLLSRTGITDLKAGNQVMQLKLSPEHLGELTIQVSEENGLIVAKIAASTEATKALLQNQIHQLKQAFITHQLPVTKVEVSASLEQGDFLQNQQQSNNEHQQSQSDEQNSSFLSVENEDEDKENAQFSDWLMARLRG